MKVSKHSDGLGFAQGDCVFIPVAALPKEVIEQKREDGRLIVAHSETGHHHAVDNPEARLFEKLQRDPMVCFLAVDGDEAELVHHREHDTHETVCLTKGIWEVHRQEEYTPAGWRQVQD